MLDFVSRSVKCSADFTGKRAEICALSPNFGSSVPLLTLIDTDAARSNVSFPIDFCRSSRNDAASEETARVCPGLGSVPSAPGESATAEQPSEVDANPNDINGIILVKWA